jgi:nitroimidazol reductase NimA-like FMN-containing flavoprotein (pyridoxamine 5'-phosphate oxidase superfamily)
MMPGELNRSQIDEILGTQAVGRIGCHASGRTYVVPINYVYDGVSSVYFQSTEGLKIQLMRANPSVCFEVDVVFDLANWQSVIAWGRFEELIGEAAAHGLEMVMKGLLPFITGEPTSPSDGLPSSTSAHLEKLRSEVIVGRLTLTEVTGRFEKR